MHLKTLIIGAGAAGLHCAAFAGNGGRTLVIDHAKKPGEKIRISGGGRCNFTNLDTRPDNFLSDNRHFAKSALARYTPLDFIKLIEKHGLTYTEKTLGQLFCDQKSGAIIQVLLDELQTAGSELWLETAIKEITRNPQGFFVKAEQAGLTKEIYTENLVIATGGKSIPKMGATSFGYQIAEQFNLPIVAARPGLVPFTFSGELKEQMSARSGVSFNAQVSNHRAEFSEGILFTHRGLSGPSLLQLSSYWFPGEDILIDFAAGSNIDEQLLAAKATNPKASLRTTLKFPNSILSFLFHERELDASLQSLSTQALAELVKRLQKLKLRPSGTEGYRTAEVTVGGVSTDALSSRTMATNAIPNLYFIGEVVDVTGWLGGYNFQWAWASAAAAGRSISRS
ncbi:MAG: NAD(P)/FAD-dependent oxidoreductase [Alphaproteobacteria bacterium]